MSKTKLSDGTLTHHLYVLEREKIIISYADGRFKRYRLHPEQEKKSAEEILSDINKADEVMRMRILNLIKEKDCVTQREIYKILGGSKQIISYHIRNLEADGMIKTEKYGLTKKCYLRRS